ncbi:MAG: hypothetical protein GXX86_04990, partial [Propionibacterium sp.]|nr:hypothetical protein [Propionibacterium sp.]
MALFGRRRRTPSEPPRSPQWLEREAEIERRIAAEPPITWADTSFTDPYAGFIATALQAGDFASLDARYAGLTGLDRAAWGESTTVAVTELLGPSPQLLGAAESHGTVASLLVAITVANDLGFESRGTGMAHEVSHDQRSGYEAGLHHALQLAERANSLSGGTDPTPLM